MGDTPSPVCYKPPQGLSTGGQVVTRVPPLPATAPSIGRDLSFFGTKFFQLFPLLHPPPSGLATHLRPRRPSPTLITDTRVTHHASPPVRARPHGMGSCVLLDQVYKFLSPDPHFILSCDIRFLPLWIPFTGKASAEGVPATPFGVYSPLRGQGRPPPSASALLVLPCSIFSH